MIFITGDTHGDQERLSKTELSMIKSDDTLIICGDFGFIWNNDSKEAQFLNRLEKRNYTICFVDGIHENFNVLNNYPVVIWNGGRVHKIRNNIFHLMRGQIYEIENKKFFTMGGGENPELDLHEEDDLSEHKEIPSTSEMLNGVSNLEKHNYKVDYIITHEPPSKIRDFLLLSSNKTLRVTTLGAYLDELSQQTDFKRWYFAGMHIDKFISDSYTAIFRNIVSIEGIEQKKKFSLKRK
ncbi:MAG: metallophosphoesterase [Clostridia bacterium]|nr:metallophosphoesterase [Clostridia bacterium]